MDREEAMARRVVAQQLDRERAERALTDADALDLGVQDTGRDAASWALANRGVPVAERVSLEQADELVLVWSLRGAPHYYRRADLQGVLDAVSPFDDADARKRTLNASKQLAAVGVDMLEGLGVVAEALREVVTTPMTKGDVSGALNARLPEPYLHWCNPCQATHVYEQPFRFAALFAGLELMPGTSPPVLRPVPGWRRPPGPGDPEQAPRRLGVIEGYLRLLGPATPADVAGFLEAPLTVVKQHWPVEAVETDVDGHRAWVLPGPPPRPVGPGLVRLLGSHDLYLQARDRERVVPDRARHKALWPVIGRPGAVLVGTEVVGTWRPRASGKTLNLVVDLWSRVPAATRTAIADEADRLAAHRGLGLGTVDLGG